MVNVRTFYLTGNLVEASNYPRPYKPLNDFSMRVLFIFYRSIKPAGIYFIPTRFSFFYRQQRPNKARLFFTF